MVGGAAFTVSSFLSTLIFLSFFPYLLFFSFLFISFLSFFLSSCLSLGSRSLRESAESILDPPPFLLPLGELPTYFSGCCFNLLGSLNPTPPPPPPLPPSLGKLVQSIVSVGLIHRSSPSLLPRIRSFRVGGNPQGVSGRPVPIQDRSSVSITVFVSYACRSRRKEKKRKGE